VSFRSSSLVLAPLIGLALSSSMLLTACNGCGKKTAPARALDASAASESKTMRRLATDRTTARAVVLDELVKDMVQNPSGATPSAEGELVRLKGTVLEVKDKYVVFQDGTYAATCDLAAGVPPEIKKDTLIEITGFYLHGGGHVAARFTDCEIALRGGAPLKAP
jgi:hypothetical protein